jgi:hypothetical protein
MNREAHERAIATVSIFIGIGALAIEQAQALECQGYGRASSHQAFVSRLFVPDYQRRDEKKSPPSQWASLFVASVCGKLRLVIMADVRTYNVEAGLPTLEEARRLVMQQLKEARRERARVLKVIHGYGSSGKGGALCVGLRRSFGLRKKEGVIKDFIRGEDFSIFNPTVLSMLDAVPALRGDPDLNATNEGVTVLWLK